MKQVRTFPPNWRAIRAAFPAVVGKPVYVTYGDTLHNLSGRPLPPQLLAHERVHMTRQLMSSPERWWQSYIEDKQFRLDEELVAHEVELRVLRDRGARRADLLAVADRLALPMYNNMVTRAQARELLGMA